MDTGLCGSLLQEAKYKFLKSGMVAAGVVRADVLTSWQRSKAFGLLPDRLSDQRARDVDSDAPLVRAATPVLRRIADDTSPHVVGIVLTSADGLVLERIASNSALIHKLDQVRLAPGYSCAEQVAGTNGIGTSLEARKPIFITGCEHYVDALTDLACAGTPIRDPLTRRVVGLLNLSCWANQSDPLLYTLVKNAGFQIEQRLAALKSEADIALLEAYRRYTRRHPGEVLGLGGDLVLMSQCLRESVGPADHHALLTTAAAMIETGATAACPLLPSGSSARISVLEQAVRCKRIDAVFHVQMQSTAEAVASPITPLRIPGLAGRNWVWQRCCRQVESYCRDRSWVVIDGERGSGRAKLAQAVARYVVPQRAVRVLRASEYSSADDFVSDVEAQTEGDDFVVVLADIDELPDDGVAALAMVLETRVGHGWVAVTSAQPRSSLVDTLIIPLFTHTVAVPPLRHRLDDITELVPMLLRELTRGADVRLAPEATHQLAKLTWPGNVAQLRGVLAAAVATQRSGLIGIDKLPAECRSLSRRKLTHLEALERDAIVLSLLEHGGDKAAAAENLGMSRATIYRKIRHYGIT